MDNITRIEKVFNEIKAIDKDTGGKLHIVKAFYLKGVASVLEDGALVEAIADVNLDTTALIISNRFKDLSLATHEARQAGKKHAEVWRDL